MEKRTPRDIFLRKKKNASGGVEAKFLSCKECGIEFCTGNRCKIFDYDSFKRVAVSTVQTANELQTQEPTSQEKKSLKKKSLKKGPKLKTRASNTPALVQKSDLTKHENKIISVKTNKKTLTIQNKTMEKSNENIKPTKHNPSRKNIEMKKRNNNERNENGNKIK